MRIKTEMGAAFSEAVNEHTFDIVKRLFNASTASYSQIERDQINTELMNDPNLRKLYLGNREAYYATPFKPSDFQHCPPNSLGREYLRFMERYGLDYNFYRLTEVSDPLGFFVNRLRKTHDIWHLMAGFGSDPNGEIGIQGLYLAQYGMRNQINVLISFLIHEGMRGNTQSIQTAIKYLIDGYEIGAASQKLMGVPWEDRLKEDLGALRKELNVRKTTLEDFRKD